MHPLHAASCTFQILLLSNGNFSTLIEFRSMATFTEHYPNAWMMWYIYVRRPVSLLCKKVASSSASKIYAQALSGLISMAL